MSQLDLNKEMVFASSDPNVSHAISRKIHACNCHY